MISSIAQQVHACLALHCQPRAGQWLGERPIAPLLMVGALLADTIDHKIGLLTSCNRLEAC